MTQDRFRCAWVRSPWTGLLVSLVCLAVEGGLIVRSWHREHLIRLRIEQGRARCQVLRTSTPVASPAAVAEAVRICAVLEASAAERLAEWHVPTGEAAEARESPAVRERADAFFDLAWFVEYMRAAAAERDVRLNDAEHFGFASHTRSAPTQEQVDRVLRQRLRLEALLTSLFDARPARLESVRRESPDGAVAGRARTSESSTPDHFSLESRLSLRRSGWVDTLAFRVAFTGDTACLRRFINRVASDPTPWVVRLVEVEPEAPGGAALPTEGDRSPALPAIRPRPLRFVVTVESVEGLVGRRSESGGAS